MTDRSFFAFFSSFELARLFLSSFFFCPSLERSRLFWTCFFSRRSSSLSDEEERWRSSRSRFPFSTERFDRERRLLESFFLSFLLLSPRLLSARVERPRAVCSSFATACRPRPVEGFSSLSSFSVSDDSGPLTTAVVDHSLEFLPVRRGTGLIPFSGPHLSPREPLDDLDDRLSEGDSFLPLCTCFFSVRRSSLRDSCL